MAQGSAIVVFYRDFHETFKAAANLALVGGSGGIGQDGTLVSILFEVRLHTPQTTNAELCPGNCGSLLETNSRCFIFRQLLFQ